MHIFIYIFAVAFYEICLGLERLPTKTPADFIRHIFIYIYDGHVFWFDVKILK